MVFHGQFVEPGVLSGDLQACQDLIYSCIRQKPRNNMLRQNVSNGTSTRQGWQLGQVI